MIKKIFLAMFLFIILYLDSVYLGPVKWAQLWKGLFVIIMIGSLLFKKEKTINIISIYLYMVGFYMITPFYFVNFNEIIIKIIGLLFFPSIFLFIHNLTRKEDDYMPFLSFMSVFVILSFVPFYLGLIPQLGATYDLNIFGISGKLALSGLFQQPHPASQILAYSCVSLFYVISKTKNKVIKYQLIFILSLGFFFQLQTYVRLGLVMTIVGAIIYYLYKTDFIKKMKVLPIIIIISTIAFSFLKSSDSFETYSMRFFGENKHEINYHDSEDLDYNKISSGRLNIWSSSINNLFLNSDAFEIMCGITETELKKRNKKTVQLAVFSHNGFIDSLVTNGLIGFFIFMYFIITWAKLLIKKNRRHLKNSLEIRYTLAVFTIYLTSIMLQGGLVIYEGYFLSISLLILLKKETQYEY